MKWLLVFVAIVAGLYGCYALMFPSPSIRYRLTLEAEVDGKPAIGSGVIEVTFHEVPDFLGTIGWNSTIKGEAVVLDLGARGTVFALLRGRRLDLDMQDGSPETVFGAFLRGEWRGSRAGLIRVLKQQKPKAELPTRLLPLLVRFRDINDRMSVERVDPDNFAATFGPGVSLRRATVEITDDPITTDNIERRLPWLSSLGSATLDGTMHHVDSSLTNNLGALSFRRWGL